jgi:hypothetical protein
MALTRTWKRTTKSEAKETGDMMEGIRSEVINTYEYMRSNMSTGICVHPLEAIRTKESVEDVTLVP